MIVFSRIKNAIVNYEIWQDGKPVKWGNLTISYTAATSGAVDDAIREHVSGLAEVPAQEIRIVGVFPL